MSSVASYVFLDLETTGFPREENNKTKITEISLVAVKREHVLDTRVGASPRVQNKLTLCLNPRKLVSPESTKVTGLCNDLLEQETDFNIEVFNLINTFLNVLTKPVCLVAQNGQYFDFPILKRHVEYLKVSLSDDLLCADCYHAFYDIETERKKAKMITKVIDNEEPGSPDLYTLENTLAMQSVNEETPVKKTKFCKSLISKAKRRFPWNEDSKPKESYKLKNVYERLLNRPALEAHRAENDCILALECCVALGKDFVEWIDNNHIPFTEVKPMTIGVPLGS